MKWKPIETAPKDKARNNEGMDIDRIPKVIFVPAPLTLIFEDGEPIGAIDGYMEAIPIAEPPTKQNND